MLESLDLGSRLTRGNAYARRFQVVALEVGRGQCHGSGSSPYAVTIGLAPFSELVWAKVEGVLAEQAIHSARLLAGELPAELESVFAAASAPLFPRRGADLKMRCSCHDHDVPCKHLGTTSTCWPRASTSTRSASCTGVVVSGRLCSAGSVSCAATRPETMQPLRR